MTTLLEKAVNKISKLPENEQNEIAKIILEEIDYIKTQQRKKLLEQFGKIKWEGNLKQMREI